MKTTSGWYSSEAADKYGASYYRHVDGHEVLVTGVCNDYGWPDKVYVGEVTEHIRHAFDGYFSDILDQYDDFGYEEYPDNRDILYVQEEREYPEFEDCDDDWDMGGEGGAE